VFRLSEAVRDAFADTGVGSPVGPFNFFHPEQRALGKLVMSRTQGQHGMELDTISTYKFKKRLALPALANSLSVQQSLQALHEAQDAGDLRGRNRLAKAQNHLVDLLNYLEAKEGFRLFTGERKKVSNPRERSARNGAGHLSAANGLARSRRSARVARRG